jgi:hypothetical protein
MRPAVALNAKALFVACDGYTMVSVWDGISTAMHRLIPRWLGQHRDPKATNKHFSDAEAEDRRRVFCAFASSIAYRILS